MLRALWHTGDSYTKAQLTPGKLATAVCVWKACFCHLTVVWRPLAEKYLAISTQSTHRWKVHLVGYNFVADNTGLSSFVYLLLPPKHEKCREIPREFQENLTLQQFKVIQGHRSWCQWKAHTLLACRSPSRSTMTPICDFLLVINCNCSRICYLFRDIHA